MMPPNCVKDEDKEHAHCSTVLRTRKARSHVLPQCFPKQDLYLAVPWNWRRWNLMRHVPFCLLILSLAGSIAGAQTAQKTATMASNPAFSKLTDRFVKESLALSPVNASYAGYHKYTDPKTGKVRELDAELDDVSAQSFAAQEAFYQ